MSAFADKLKKQLVHDVANLVHDITDLVEKQAAGDEMFEKTHPGNKTTLELAHEAKNLQNTTSNVSVANSEPPRRTDKSANTRKKNEPKAEQTPTIPPLAPSNST